MASDAMSRHVNELGSLDGRPRGVQHVSFTRTAMTAAAVLPMATSDEALIARILAGDTDAYAALVSRYRDRGARYAMRMLGNREEAEEALQDAFVRAYRALRQCQDPQHFDRWFLRILVNRCRSAGARWWRQHRRFVDQPIEEQDLSHDAGDGGLAWRDEIGRALARLDARVREAFLLKHVEELTYDEMAAMTGVGVSALKMRVQRACTQLRELLDEGGHDD